MRKSVDGTELTKAPSLGGLEGETGLREWLTHLLK